MQQKIHGIKLSGCQTESTCSTDNNSNDENSSDVATESSTMMQSKKEKIELKHKYDQNPMIAMLRPIRSTSSNIKITKDPKKYSFQFQAYATETNPNDGKIRQNYQKPFRKKKKVTSKQRSRVSCHQNGNTNEGRFIHTILCHEENLNHPDQENQNIL